MNRRGFSTVKFGLALLITAVFLTAYMTAAVAQESQPTAAELEAASNQFAGVIKLAVGQVATLKVDGLDRYQIGAPNIAGIQKSEDGTQLLITGKKIGSTVLNVWQKGTLSKYQVQVLASVGEGGAIAGIQSITLKPGASQIIRGKGIKRTATSDPNAVDIVPVSTSEIILNAKSPGTSVVRVWDDYGLTTYNITVQEPIQPKVDLSEELTREIGIPNVRAQVSDEKGKRVITLLGEVPSMDLAQKAERTASAYGTVQNLIKVESEAPSKLVDSLRDAIDNPRITFRVLPDETILIEGTVPTQEEALRIRWITQTWLGTVPQETKDDRSVAIIGATGEAIITPDTRNRARLEVGTNETTTGGADIVANDERNVIRHVWGGRLPEGPRIVAIIEVNPALARQVMVRAQIVEIDRNRLKELGVEWGEIDFDTDQEGDIQFRFVPQPFVVGEAPNGVRPLDDIGPIRRLRSLGAQIRALVTENSARILSEPKVLIVDGGVANIHIGGQIPIPVAQSNALGAGAITVEFKDFGILLTVRPKITADGRIYMAVSPEASSLDFSNAVVVNNFTIPAIRQRRATTSVHVNDGQSLVIGGLISNEEAKLIRRIPLLSEIPIIGELFKSREFVRNETELIIIVTPQVVERSATPATTTGAVPAAP